MNRFSTSIENVVTKHTLEIPADRRTHEMYRKIAYAVFMHRKAMWSVTYLSFIGRTSYFHVTPFITCAKLLHSEYGCHVKAHVSRIKLLFFRLISSFYRRFTKFLLNALNKWFLVVLGVAVLSLSCNLLRVCNALFVYV